MKVEQQSKEFSPITITLETREEALALLLLMGELKGDAQNIPNLYTFPIAKEMYGKGYVLEEVKGRISDIEYLLD